MKSVLLITVLTALTACSPSHKVERNEVCIAIAEEQPADSIETAGCGTRVDVFPNLRGVDSIECHNGQSSGGRFVLITYRRKLGAKSY